MSLTYRTLPLDHPEIVEYLAGPRTYSIMVHEKDLWSRRKNNHHFKPHFDEGGLYVRMAQRGQIKRYLDRAEVTYMDGQVLLVQFRTVQATLGEPPASRE